MAFFYFQILSFHLCVPVSSLVCLSFASSNSRCPFKDLCRTARNGERKKGRKKEGRKRTRHNLVCFSESLPNHFSRSLLYLQRSIGYSLSTNFESQTISKLLPSNFPRGKDLQKICYNSTGNNPLLYLYFPHNVRYLSHLVIVHTVLQQWPYLLALRLV